MARDVYAQNAFANSFMQGFSFVDQIQARKKADARLEQQLKEEREEKAFQRKRQVSADQRLSTVFEQGQQDRTNRLEDEKNAEDGDAFVLANPKATADELAQFPHSPLARQRIATLNARGEFASAVTEVQGLRNQGGGAAQTQPQSNGAQSPASLSDVVAQNAPAMNATGLPTMNAQERADHAQLIAEEEGTASISNQGFGFAPSRGQDSLQEVDVDELSKFDPAYKEQGAFGKAGSKIAGFGAQISRGFEDIFVNPQDPLTRGTGANIGDEFSGTVQVPADRYTSEEEFAEMSDPREIAAARAENERVAVEYAEAGRKPRAFSLGSWSRQGAQLETSDQARVVAVRQEQQAVRRTEQFLDPSTTSPMEELALKDPTAATVMYFQDRATLENANPDMMLAMDRRMLPIVDTAVEQMRIDGLQYGDGPKGRAHQQKLAQLMDSRNKIAKGQPSISKTAGIRNGGVSPGDAPRVQQVMDEIYNPERPTAAYHANAQLGAAATTAMRVTPNKRINEKQIEALAILAESGWIDKPTAMSVMMTGQWPPGKNPNGIKKIQEAGDTVYALTEDGGYFVLQSGKNGGANGEVPSREIGEDQVNWATAGMRAYNPNMSDRDAQDMLRLMYTEPGWVRSRFNVTSQEDMRKLGYLVMESKSLAGDKYKDMQDGFLWFDGNTKDAPTWKQVLMDEQMRSSIATDLDLEYTPIPEIKDTSGYDIESMRQTLREGRLGPDGVKLADSLTDEEVAMIMARKRHMDLDAQGRIAEDGSILPEQQGN